MQVTLDHTHVLALAGFGLLLLIVALVVSQADDGGVYRRTRTRVAYDDGYGYGYGLPRKVARLRPVYY